MARVTEERDGARLWLKNCRRSKQATADDVDRLRARVAELEANCGVERARVVEWLRTARLERREEPGTIDPFETHAEAVEREQEKDARDRERRAFHMGMRIAADAIAMGGHWDEPETGHGEAHVRHGLTTVSDGDPCKPPREPQ
jgi:hypothetical protein